MVRARLWFVLPAAVLLPLALPSFRYRLGREICYQRLSDRICSGETSPEHKALRVLIFVHNRMNGVGGPVVDDDCWQALRRGEGWCDQQAWTMGALLARQGIASRLLEWQHHTVLEVWLGGDWRIMDPYTGVVCRGAQGAPVTLAELRSQPDLVRRSARYCSLPRPAQEDITRAYAELQQPPHRVRIRASPLGVIARALLCIGAGNLVDTDLPARRAQAAYLCDEIPMQPGDVAAPGP